MTEVGARGRLVWSQLPLRPIDVAHRVVEIVAAEAELPAFTDSTGPTGSPPPGAARRGPAGWRGAVAAALPEARVAVAVDEEGLWPTLPGLTQVARDASRDPGGQPGGDGRTARRAVLRRRVDDVTGGAVTAPAVDRLWTRSGPSWDAASLGEQPGELTRLRLGRDNLDAVFAAGAWSGRRQARSWAGLRC